MRFRLAILSLLLCAGVALSGCAVWNPHVTWERPKAGKRVTLQDAIEYANKAKDAYKGAVGDQALLTNTLATGLIPLGGAALGAGIAGVPAGPLTYLALSGATIYSVGTWLSSAPRQSVYIAGINGITCAVEAVLPLNFKLVALNSGLEEFNKQAGLAESYAREVTRLISEVKDVAKGETSQTKSAAESVNSARSVMEMAQSNYGDGVSLSHLHGRAGQLLVAKVDDIDALVAVQIKNTQPDLQSLPNLIQGLGQTARTLTPLPPGAAQLLGAEVKPGAIEAQSEDLVEQRAERESRLVVLEKELSEALSNMNVAVGALSAASTKVGAIVNSATRSEPSDTLKNCGVDEVETSLSVRKPGDRTLPQGGRLRIRVRGGKAPYRAFLTPEPAEGVSVLEPTGADSTVWLIAEAKAKPMEYHLIIEDAALNDTSVKIIVVGTEEKKKTAGTTPALEEFRANIETEEIEAEDVTYTVSGAKVEDGKVKVNLIPKTGTSADGVSLESIKTKLIALDPESNVTADLIDVENYPDVKNGVSQ